MIYRAMSRLIFYATVFGQMIMPLASVAAIESKPIEPSHRIVSLSPATTEMLFDLGLGSMIVGTTEYSNTPPDAKNIQRIGAYQRPNMEMILTLRPTIVVGMSEGVDTVSSTLKRFNIPLLTLNTQTLSDFKKNMATLGETFLVQKRADDFISKWNKNWSQIPKIKRPIRVIIQVDQDPLMLVGQQTYLNEIVNRCGATNIFQQTGYKKISREAVARLNPEKILTFMQFDHITRPQIRSYWQTYPLLKEARIEFFDPDHISRLTFQLSKMALQICSKITQTSS